MESLDLAKTADLRAILAERGFPVEDVVLQRLYLVARRRVNFFYTGASVEDREDAIQEVMLVLSKKYLRCKPSNGDAGLSALTGRIATNVSYAGRRKLINRTNHETVLNDDFDLADPNGTIADPVLDNDTITKIFSVLPTRQREILRLSVLEGHSHDEISQRLGIGKGTIMNALSRALTTLRKPIHCHLLRGGSAK